MASFPQNLSSNIPPDLKCSICWDIAIDPVVPSTEDKTKKICVHFLCSSCEFINRQYQSETTGEVQCPVCREKYQNVISDDILTEKIIDFVKNNPHIFNNKSYEELVKDRKESIPIEIQIIDAIKLENFDELEKIISSIKEDQEKNRIIFIALNQQILNEKIDIAKRLIYFMPTKIGQLEAANHILNFYMQSKNFIDAEEFVFSLSEAHLKSKILSSLIGISVGILSLSTSSSEETLDIFSFPTSLSEETKEFLIQNIPKYIKMYKDLPLTQNPLINDFNISVMEADFNFSVGNEMEAKRFVKEAKQLSEQMPINLKYFLLITLARSLINDNGLKILKKITNDIMDLKVLPGTKYLFITSILSCYLVAKNLTPEDLSNMEYLAKELPLGTMNIFDLKNDIEKDLKNDPTEIIGKSEYQAMNIERDQMLDLFESFKINAEFSQEFALFLTAETYFKHKEILGSLRILNDLNSISEDSVTINFLNTTINLRDQITSLIRSIFIETLYTDNNFVMCLHIINSGYIQNKEVIKKFQESLQDALISKVLKIEKKLTKLKNTVANEKNLSEKKLTELKDILAHEKKLSNMRNDLANSREECITVKLNQIEKKVAENTISKKDYCRFLTKVSGIVLLGFIIMSKKMYEFGS